MRWFLVKLAIQELVRRKFQAALIIVGLMISTAVITGSLVVGDSMEYLVYTSTFENLGDVDLVIRSGEFFNYNYYSTIADNATLAEMIDKHAPIILLPCSLEASVSNLRENKANLFGFADQIQTFGSFIRSSTGDNFGDNVLTLKNDEIIINDNLASKLELNENDKVRLYINNPIFKLESVYSSREGLNSIARALTIKYIVQNEGLGRLQLDGRTSKTSNAFMKLNHLQELLGIGKKINSILISNVGDKYTGIAHEDSVASAITQCLDEEIGIEELGYELNYTDLEYLRLVNNDIFFDENINELLTEYEQEPGSGFVTSPVLTYFVNSISFNRTKNSINYSMVTGLNFTKDRIFGEFTIGYPTLAKDHVENIELATDEMILIDWAAERLGVSVGDSVTIEYMVLDQIYNIYNTTYEFKVKYIIELTGKASDPKLMPTFPGLVGKLDCVHWDPPFPINLSRITRSDREYWLEYQGTPKAYINLEQAQNLWSTNLGAYTMIKINSSPEVEKDLKVLENQIVSYLDNNLGESEAGLGIAHVKSDALKTASGMSIFPLMFLAFGSAIIIAGMALIVTIFLILAEARKYELGIGRALGLKRAQVVKLFMLEGVSYAVLSGIIGVLFGLFLGWGLVAALNSIWSSAVQEHIIPFYFKPISLLLGFFTGFIITILTLYFTSRHIAKINIISAIRDLPGKSQRKKHGLVSIGGVILFLGIICLFLGFSKNDLVFDNSEFYFNLLGPVLSFIGGGLVSMYFINQLRTRRFIITILILITLLYIIIYSFSSFSKPNAPTMELFFIVGLLLVLGLVILIITNLDVIANSLLRIFSLGNRPGPVSLYSLKNPTRRVSRTGQIIGIFTLVIFLLAALSINIAIQQASVNVVSYEQRGGYDIIGETAVPISIDLENKTQQVNYNLATAVLNNVTVTEIKMVGPPGGSCSNMNVRYPPRLLGVNNGFIQENGFRFMETLSGSQISRNTWEELEETAEENNGRIPIVVDYNTLVWIYNGALGEIYEVMDEPGNNVKLEVIGILENSVFGGTFIMSQDNLESLYPTTAEYRYVLFKLKPGFKGSPEASAAELENELHRYGMDAQAIRELIHENQAYERSFMVLFQAFLGLGLIIGVIGLGVVTARTVQERRFEIGVLRALGFKRKMVLKAFLLEPSFTGLLAIILGLLVGIISSYLAFGSWTGGRFEFVIPWLELGILALFIYLVILLSAGYPAYRASKLPPAEALQRVG